jgi:monoamine oxidase
MAADAIRRLEHGDVVAAPHRDHMLRRLGDRLYSEEEPADPKVLAGFGFHAREVAFLRRHAWWELPNLYFAPYLDAFADEYKPFDAGLTGSTRSPSPI